jgi:hypothetical protein
LDGWNVSWIPGYEPGVSRFLSNLAWLFANLAGHQQPTLWFYVPRIRCYQPAVFTHIAKLLSHVACVRLSNFAVILSHVTKAQR